MTKILIEPIDLNHIEYLNDTNINGYIIGLKCFAIFQNLKLSVEEIKHLNVNNKELYISINKPVYNNELKELTIALQALSKLKINGILFEDIAVYNLNKRLKLNLNLIWSQMHLGTNQFTCNYWQDKGVIGSLLSTELRLEDYINIKKNTKMKIMVNLYGHLPIFESSRTLISNYLTYTKQNYQDGNYYIHEKNSGKHYLIYEEYDNTFLLGDVLNGINVLSELIKNNIDYIVLNSLKLDSKEFNMVVNEYLDVLNGEKLIKENVYEGFLFTESYFRVKE